MCQVNVNTLVHSHTSQSSKKTVSYLINSHFLSLLSRCQFDPISVAEGSNVRTEIKKCEHERKADRR